MSGVSVVGIVLAGIVIVAGMIGIWMIKPNKRRDVSIFYGKKYAHRGLHEVTIPENSLPAFERVRESGYGVELDIQMTKDGKLVVFHDDSLERMCGFEGHIRNLTYEELMKLSLGDTDEKIPLFSTVLEVLQDVDLICEIKSNNGIKNDNLCAKVYVELRKYRGNYCIESFSPFLVEWFRKNHPEIIRGQLSYNMRKEISQTTLINFYCTHLLVNVISRPDFIAYRYTDINMLGYRICKVLYHPLAIAWAPKGSEEIARAEKDFDTIIFEA